MRHATACLASAAIVAATLAAVPARAADDLGSNPIAELFGAIGLSDKEKPDIDYRERPTLVPPVAVGELPPPQQKGSVGQATGQWPNDPDEARRAAKRAEDNLPRTEQRDYKMDRNPRLPPNEITGRRVAPQPEEPGVGGYRPSAVYDASPVLSPTELRGRKIQSAEAPALAPGVEPTRRRLTDPPPGYRAPSATAPYVAPEEVKKPWYKRMNPFASE